MWDPPVSVSFPFPFFFLRLRTAFSLSSPIRWIESAANLRSFLVSSCFRAIKRDPRTIPPRSHPFGAALVVSTRHCRSSASTVRHRELAAAFRSSSGPIFARGELAMPFSLSLCFSFVSSCSVARGSRLRPWRRHGMLPSGPIPVKAPPALSPILSAPSILNRTAVI
jgi:hypothetical protein